MLRIERLDLAGGIYSVDVSAFGERPDCRYVCEAGAASIAVRSRESGKGLLLVPHQWQAGNPQCSATAEASVISNRP